MKNTKNLSKESRGKDLTKFNPFGRLTAIRRAPKPEGQKSRAAWWFCSCSCGNPDLIAIRADSLTSGNTTSCGCIVREHDWESHNETFLEKGVNDLETLHPEIASEAYGWDPSSYLPGSNKPMLWRCKKSHKPWTLSIDNRVRSKTLCPYCFGKLPIVGETDLKTLYPEIAAQADGWDPTEYTGQSNDEMPWICNLGHPFPQMICNRTGKNEGCPYCSGKKPLLGFNTVFDYSQRIAAEADGWDPKKVVKGSSTPKPWRCKRGHKWITTPDTRIRGDTKCEWCSGSKPIVGETDLKTLYPEIAADADGWDPTEYTGKSSSKKNWKCKKCSYKWGPVRIKDRTTDRTKCPLCADKGGYRRDKDGWLYLMFRPDEMQIGITNQLEARYQFHKAKGWEPKDGAIGPHDGDLIYHLERAIKKWLKENVGTIQGTTENWETKKFKVSTLKTLFKKVGLELPKAKSN